MILLLVRCCSTFLSLMYRLIVLTRGTGRGMSLSASTLQQGLPPAHPANSRRLGSNRVVSPSSRIQHLAAAHCSHPRPRLASPRSAAFLEEKLAALLLTSFPHPVGFLCQKECYQLTRTWSRRGGRGHVVVDALRNLPEHQGQRYSFSKCLHCLRENIPDFPPFFIDGIFLHFSWRKIQSERQHFSPFFFGKKSCLKATFLSIFQVQFRCCPGGSTPSIPNNHDFRSRSC
jgi:hypothetical protein